MTMNQLTRVAKVVVWPATILILVIVLRMAVSGAIERLKVLEGPNGVKATFYAVNSMTDRLQRVEDLTTDIYHLSGESEAVRDEIFGYVADIINRASPQTALEMRTELNKYHMPRLEVSAAELKKMLNKLNLYERSESERDGFNDDIHSKLIEAICNFQKTKDNLDVDGIIGPNTLKQLKSEVQL